MPDSLKKHMKANSEFDHRYACWAINHMGWAKMKKANRKLAKKRLREETKKEIESGLAEE